jgi:hypothetical protein
MLEKSMIARPRSAMALSMSPRNDIGYPLLFRGDDASHAGPRFIH